MSPLVVVLDCGVSLQSEPLRNGLVLLGGNTKGALGTETLLAGHFVKQRSHLSNSAGCEAEAIQFQSVRACEIRTSYQFRQNSSFPFITT